MSFFLLGENSGRRSALLRQPDEIVCADLVKLAELDEVFDLQLGPSVLDVAVALLGFVDDRAHFLLRQIPVLPQIPHSDSVVHRIPPA